MRPVEAPDSVDSQDPDDAPAVDHGAAPAAIDGLPLRLVLDLDAAAAEAFRRCTLLTAHAARRPATRKTGEVYWDTPGFSLGRAGFALSLQAARRGRKQVMCGIGRRITGGARVAEVEQTIDGDRPDPIRLAFLPGADATLIGSLDATALHPAFAIDRHRTQWAVSYGDARFTVVLERGSITATGGRRDFLSAALTLTGGAAPGLYDFARALRSDLAFRLATHDIVQRGYCLASGEDWWPARPALSLKAELTVRQALLAIGRAAIAETRVAFETLHTAPTPEHIHLARVALRRLRSGLSVFAEVLPPAPCRRMSRDLGDLARRLGSVRELDVFLVETVQPLIATLGMEPALKSLGLTVAVLRERTTDGLRNELAAAETAVPSTTGSQGFMDLSLRLAAWFDAGLLPEPADPDGLARLDGPIDDFARAILRKRHRRLIRAGEGLSDPKPADLHQLRIAVKKLRYATEFFRTLFPSKPVKRYLETLRRVQDILGVLNDADVGLQLLPRLTDARSHSDARAAGLIAGWTAAKTEQARDAFAPAWDGFRSAKRFWKAE